MVVGQKLTIRIRPLGLSAIYKLEPLKTTLLGLFSVDAVASPPLAEKPIVPVPATVVIIPVLTVILRTQ